MTPKRERNADIFAMRQQDPPATFKEIADKHGISPGRAAQIYDGEVRHRSWNAKWEAVGFGSLNTRARNALWNDNINSIDDLRTFAALHGSKTRDVLLRVPNLGNGGVAEIMALLEPKP